MKHFFMTALILAWGLPALADEPTATDVRASTIAPFLDTQTMVVGHADLSRLDVDSIVKTLGVLAAPEAEQQKEMRQGLSKWLAAFRKAGGKDIYVLLSLEDMPESVPLLMVPLADGADTAALDQLLPDNLFPATRDPRENLKPVKWHTDKFLFRGTKATQQRLKELKPAQRPELAKGFAAAGATDLQVILMLPPHMARVIEEVIPRLPPEIGDGSSRVLTEGVRWAALGVDWPPKTSVKLMIQSRDAAAAEASERAVPAIHGSDPETGFQGSGESWSTRLAKRPVGRRGENPGKNHRGDQAHRGEGPGGSVGGHHGVDGDAIAGHFENACQGGSPAAHR